jgi:hypothetical protein
VALGGRERLHWTREMHERMVSSLQSYQHRANIDERHSMAQAITTAALTITDRPWTFAELENATATLLGQRVD